MTPPHRPAACPAIIGDVSEWFRDYGFAEVHPNLVIGAMPLDSEDVEMLARMRVDRVLNLTEDEEYAPGQRQRVTGALAMAGIPELRVPMTDFAGLPAEAIEAAVEAVLEWLQEEQRVYLHCRAGWQRSAAVAAAVVACAKGIGVEDALDLVRTRKRSADPLPHQRADLRRWWDGRPG